MQILKKKIKQKQKVNNGKGDGSLLQEGIQENQIEIIKKMKQENIDIMTISKITGLTEIEINKIISSN